MYLKSTIVFIVTYVCVTNAIVKSRHDYITEQFRRSAEGINLTAIKTKWFKQPLDHFNLSDTRKWNMRYFENLNYFVAGGPLYLYINGEGEAECYSLQVGIMAELAKETRGAMWGTEHRYYGNSQPFPETSTPDYKYLSSRQALADIANFIQQLKQTPEFSSSKVVVVGGSYAGNLAAWMRLLYPELVDAALSSSAPVLAKANFYEYLETVGDVFKKYAKPDCFESINAFIDRYKSLLSTEAGIEQFKEELDICPDVDMSHSNNKGLFFLQIASEFSMVAQYGHPDDVNKACGKRKCMGTKVKYVKNALNFPAGCGCWNIDYKMVACHAWLYQVCTEFGYFITSPDNEPFADTSIKLDLFYKQCSICFGPDVNETTVEASVDKTNEMYGGLNPNLTNVIFSHGEIDPWHRLGILEDLSETVPAIIIPKTSHCKDLVSSNDEEMTFMQQKEKSFIKKWIGIANPSNL